MEKNNQHVQVPKMNLKEDGLESFDPFVYASVKRFMNNQTKIAFPSIKTLMVVTKMSRNALIHSLERLESSQYIKIIKEFGKPNQYLFNNYKKFECFSYDFLDMDELSYNEKAYLVMAQPHMLKDATLETGTIHYDQETFAEIMGLSINTLKKIEKHLQELHILQMKPTNQKELMLANNKYIPSTGLNLFDREYSFPAFCNEVAFKLQEHEQKISEHDQQIEQLQKVNQDLQKKIEEIEKQIYKASLEEAIIL